MEQVVRTGLQTLEISMHLILICIVLFTYTSDLFHYLEQSLMYFLKSKDWDFVFINNVDRFSAANHQIHKHSIPRTFDRRALQAISHQHVGWLSPHRLVLESQCFSIDTGEVGHLRGFKTQESSPSFWTARSCRLWQSHPAVLKSARWDWLLTCSCRGRWREGKEK